MSGYIDVGDGCWRRILTGVGEKFEMLATVLAVFVTNIPYLLALTSGTNIHKISSVSKLCHQCPKIVTDIKSSTFTCQYLCSGPGKEDGILSINLTVHFHQDCRSSIFGKLKLSFRENFVLLPDQIQFLNPIMVLILIPCFNYILYPLFAKAGFQNRAISLVHFPMF